MPCSTRQRLLREPLYHPNARRKFCGFGSLTGETISHHNTWPSATKAAFILEKQSRDQQVEAP